MEEQHRTSSRSFVLPSFILGNQEGEILIKDMISRIQHIVCLEENLFALPAVIFDRAEAARSAVSYLIGLGHQRIALSASTTSI